ncbi:MAG: hypothetical protein FWD76_01585, partial [Firmicutes bacterium]|nr:hypothetical protein [Bacillota bacterium]
MQKVCLNSNWLLDFAGRDGVRESSGGAKVDLPYCVKHEKAYFWRGLDDVDLRGVKRAFLVIDGVQGGAIVSINGVVVSSVAGGYERIDITKKLGRIANEICLEIDTRDGSSGVAGGVFLYTTDQDVYVEPDGVFVGGTKIEGAKAVQNVRVTVGYLGDAKGDSRAVQAMVEVFNHRGKRKARKLKKFKIKKSGLVVNIPININKPILYRPANVDIEDASGEYTSNGSPYIYGIKVTLQEVPTLTAAQKLAIVMAKKTGQKVAPLQPVEIDSIESKFGVRALGRRGKNLIYNGKAFKFNGVKISNTNSVLGAISLPTVEETKLKTIKANAYNIVRPVQFPTETFLNACDKVGIMCIVDVFGAMPSGMELFYNLKYDTMRESVIASRIAMLRNHPCVIAYCVGDCTNASYGRADLMEYVESVVATIRGIDDKNLVTAVVTELVPTADELEQYGGANAIKKWTSVSLGERKAVALEIGREKDIFGQVSEKYCELLDFVCYKNLSDRYEADAKKYPKRLMLGVDHSPKDLDEAISRGEDSLSVVGDMGGEYCFDYYGKSTPVNEYRQILTGAKNKVCIVAYDSDAEPVIIN